MNRTWQHGAYCAKQASTMHMQWPVSDPKIHAMVRESPQDRHSDQRVTQRYMQWSESLLKIATVTKTIMMMICFLHAPLSNRLTVLLPNIILYEWLAFHSIFWISTEGVYIQCCLVVIWPMPCETAAVLASSVYTMQPCTTPRHFMQSHIHRVHATCTFGRMTRIFYMLLQ